MSVEDQKGVPAPGDESIPRPGESGGDAGPGYEDPYAYHESVQPEVKTAVTPPAPVTSTSVTRPPSPPPPPPPEEEDDADDEGMLSMSFLEHLEELRTRIIRILMGLVVAFLLCIIFANQLWEIISAPATVALKHLGYMPNLVQITPMETFSTVWVKVPLLMSIFVASPWALYQVWAFIAPGLYKRERRWAAPFVIVSAGLFISGGLFAYFVAFRYGLEFLLGIGRGINIQPMVSVTEYFDLFVNVMLGIGLVFELPVLIFFLTLLRIATPGFLLRHSRYAILLIVLVAAVVTPTPDVFNLMLFAIPMCLLFFIGVFAGYVLTLHREHRKFPWGIMIRWTMGILAVVAAVVAVAMWKFGVHYVPHWPFLTR